MPIGNNESMDVMQWENFKSVMLWVNHEWMSSS